MNKALTLLKRIIIALSILWLGLWVLLGLGVLLDTPRQINSDAKFKKESIGPVVAYIKESLAQNLNLPSDSVGSFLYKNGATIFTSSRKLPNDKELGQIEFPKDGWIAAVHRGGWIDEGDEYYISWQDKYVTNDYGWDDGFIGFGFCAGIGLIPLILILLVLFIIKMINRKIFKESGTIQIKAQSPKDQSRIIRIVFSIFVGIIAITMAIFIIHWTIWSISEFRGITQNCQEFELSLLKANNYIEVFQKQNRRLPSSVEFQTWAIQQPGLVETHPGRGNTEKRIQMLTTDFPDSEIIEFGKPTAGSYLIIRSDGYWNEYFASWVGKSSLDPKSLNPNLYTPMINDEIQNCVIKLILSVIMLIIAFLIWPKRKTEIPQRQDVAWPPF
jgi:hypothetical protein